MSSRAPVWFEQKYVDGVIMALQTSGFLTKGMAQSESNIKGITVEWKIAGTGTATVMSTAIEERPVMNADRNVVIATMADYEANEYILSTDLEKMTQNEQQVAQMTAAKAMGRKFDQVFFAAMDADTAIVTDGDGSAAIQPADLIRNQAIILDQGIDDLGEIMVALRAQQFGQMLLYREFTNSQYTGDTPLMKKIGARSWMGMTVFPVPGSYLNAPGANIADGYMWMKSCMGGATNYDMKSRIDYVPTKKAYFAGNTMGYCSKTLLPGGFRRLRYAVPAAYVRPNP